MDDLISRRKAIEAVGYYYIPSEDKMLFADTALRHLPSESERKTGMWIKRICDEPYDEQANYECTVCGKVFGNFYYANYCPNCGASMGVE